MNVGFNNLKNLIKEKEVHHFSTLVSNDNSLEIITNDSAWPNGFYFFSQNENNLMPIDLKSINSELFFISETDKNLFDLKSMNFRPADIWYSMFTDNLEVSSYDLTNELELKIIKEKNEILFWLQSTELIFFNGFKLSEKLFLHLIQSGNFEMVSFSHHGDIIGQAFLYYNNVEAGLYFFSIFEQFRRNGFAKKALLCLFDRISKKGITRFSLQSTRQAKNLYGQIGFKMEDKIFVYKKMIYEN
jgi:ribosomal protein S18 acetylase RimI-like enzyme